MRVCSFSWSCTAPPYLLLPLLARQVHHNALAAELLRPRPRGQGGDAGGGVRMQGEGGAPRAWTPPTGRLPGRIPCPGALYPRVFDLKRYPTITWESKTTIAKLLIVQSGNIQWVHNLLTERWFKNSLEEMVFI